MFVCFDLQKQQSPDNSGLPELICYMLAYNFISVVPRVGLEPTRHL